VITQVKDTSYSKYAEFAVFPGLVLAQQIWQQQQKATIVHDPPDVDSAAHLRAVVGEMVGLLDYQQRLVGRLYHLDCV